MKHFQLIRTTALLTVCAALLPLAACNKTSAAENGAYVAGSTDASLPVSNGPLPPHDQYQRLARRAPPALPRYYQPPIPAEGYIWTPGYWDWSDDAGDYYWVPGVWVEPPEVGLYWTPGYWRYYNGAYLFSDGYWGAQVGFYGGVDYGYGYYGSGYGGGRWQGRQFYYNSRANNFGGRRIGASYSQDVRDSANRASFNGGPGGLSFAPGQAEIAASQARHAGPTRDQRDQARFAGAQPQQRAGVNRGAPPIIATTRAGEFGPGAGVTAARPVDVGRTMQNQSPARGVMRQERAGPPDGQNGAMARQQAGPVRDRPTDRAAGAPQRPAERAQPARTFAQPPAREERQSQPRQEFRAPQAREPAPALSLIHI